MKKRIAPAKINLMLHVIGRGEDGYHHLQSVMVFTDFGDDLTLSPADKTSLVISGEFGAAVDPLNNSVIKAHEWFYARTGFAPEHFQIRLTKNIPVAAGLGGGTADAAAMIKLLLNHHQLPLTKSQKEEWVLASGGLGADVPVCLAHQLGLGAAFWLDGSGTSELPQTIPFDLGSVVILLINPGIALSTPGVFKTLRGRFDRGVEAPTHVDRDFLEQTHNTLQVPAQEIASEIGILLKDLSRDDHLVRMSGSGATCFVLGNDKGDLAKLLQSQKEKHPKIWGVLTKIQKP